MFTKINSDKRENRMLYYCRCDLDDKKNCCCSTCRTDEERKTLMKIYLTEHKKMAKMRKYLFWNESGDEKEKKSMSLKKP